MTVANKFRPQAALADLFAARDDAVATKEPLDPGAFLLRGFARGMEQALWQGVCAIAAEAPFRRMMTPGGRQMSVAMSNCGALGWVTDRAGYRYVACDPESGRPWPPMPVDFLALAQRAATEAGYPDFRPDGCLVNRYEPGARMSLHQDKDEQDLGAPIVSVSLGLPALFLWGGDKRAERPRRLRLESGDVIVWGGPSRLRFHGVETPAPGEHPVTGASRVNLTFRKVG
jgi:alkylated DNA repair protein (DNA oxidative demethylase)